MNVEVFLTSSVVSEDDVRDRTAIVIDVLRTNSTIATALQNGARAVIPVADAAEGGKIASNLDQSSFLLGGERGGEKIEGYHLGNSPLEYTADTIAGRTLILNTTNGTASITKARTARHLLIGCFLNASRVADFVRQHDRDIVIICAGWRNRVTLEDTLCAGLILYHLWGGREPGLVSDGAHIAYTQYLHDQDHIETSARLCNHAQWLIEMGYEADVDYCLHVDSLPVLPYFDDNRLVLYRTSERESVMG